MRTFLVIRLSAIRADPGGEWSTVDTSADEPKSKGDRAACYHDPALAGRSARDGTLFSG
jgi:hypothetical protein